MYFIHELNITISRIIETECTIFTVVYESKISPVGTGAIFQLPRSPPECGGGGRERLRNFQISRVKLSSFLLFLGVRGASSKTIKTGLNCWQDSVSPTYWTTSRQYYPHHSYTREMWKNGLEMMKMARKKCGIVIEGLCLYFWHW